MMRLVLILIVFHLLALRAAAVDTVVDTVRLLRAIAEVETGFNPRAVGRAGERTVYQIAPGTWRRFSRVPIRCADPAEVERVARAVLFEITQSLANHRIPHTPYELALRWNAGPSARRFSTATRDYASRVSNIYHATAPFLARD